MLENNYENCKKHSFESTCELRQFQELHTPYSPKLDNDIDKKIKEVNKIAEYTTSALKILKKTKVNKKK